MNQLEESRQKIDAVDAQLVKLFEERFEAVRGVLEYKIANNMPVLDSSREKAIVEKNTVRLEHEELKPYFEKWYQAMLDVSKEYQKDHMK